MSAFFWTSGHLGWGVFAVAVFSGLWWLLVDLLWRLIRTRIARLAVAMAGGWITGVGLIILGFCLTYQ